LLRIPLLPLNPPLDQLAGRGRRGEKIDTTFAGHLAPRAVVLTAGGRRRYRRGELCEICRLSSVPPQLYHAGQVGARNGAWGFIASRRRSRHAAPQCQRREPGPTTGG